MSQVVDGHDATGTPHVSGSGEPEVTSSGMLAREGEQVNECSIWNVEAD